MSHAMTEDGRVFVFGGYDSLRRRLNDLHCLHLPSNTWTKVEIASERMPPKLTYTSLALWREEVERKEEKQGGEETTTKKTAAAAAAAAATTTTTLAKKTTTMTLTKLLLCGGYDGITARKECFEFCVEDSAWSRLADLPHLKEPDEDDDEEMRKAKKKEEEEAKRAKEGEERTRWKEEAEGGRKKDESKKTKKKDHDESKKSRKKEEEEKEEKEEEEDAWGLSEHQSIVVSATKTLYLIGGLVDTNFLHPKKIVKVDLGRASQLKEGEEEDAAEKVT